MLLRAHAGCNKFYIGEKGACLKDVILVQKQYIQSREYREIKHSEHIDLCRHGRIQVFPLRKLLSDNVIERIELDTSQGRMGLRSKK